MGLPVSIKEVPFFRLITPLLAGIACQYWLVIFPFSWWNYAVALLLLGFVFIGYLLSTRWRFRWCFGASVNLFLFFLGAILTIVQPSADKLLVNSSNRAVIYLLDSPQLRTKSLRVQVDIRYLQSNGTWWHTNEKMLVYFDIGDSLAINLAYGSVLAANITPQLVPRSGNPYQFDFKKYLSDRGIRFTAYLKPGEWMLLGNEGVGIKRVAMRLRDKLVLLFQSYGLSGDELAVASALTLGYQDLLDDELRQVYSSSGAMHILSVSGLHVGILYVLLSFLLSFLDKRTITRAIKAAILLVFLWFFALLTGLPPCVQRSAMMFSFLVVGDFFNRKSDIYNTLAASAFVLLVINPYNLLDIGFQLSYLAVISIVFFYPYIYKIIYVKSWALDKVWSLIAVSVAAQFGTFSLCLFYFNQFPNYFLLANLIAIPLSTVALYLSVFLIIVSPFPALAGLTGHIFSLTISLLNHGLEYIEKLPYSVSEGIHISALQMFSLFGLILFLSIYFLSKRVRYLFVALALTVILMADSLSLGIKRSKANELVVYSINRKSLTSFRVGDRLLFVDVDTSKEPFADKYSFFVKGYISAAGAVKRYEVANPVLANGSAGNRSIVKIVNRDGISFVSFRGRIVAIPFGKNLDRMIGNRQVAVDYLVINRYTPYRVLDFFDPKVIIIDSSVSKKTLTNVALACTHRHLPFHITSSQGAYVCRVENN